MAAMLYRADQVGSLLRPPELLEARAANAAARMTLEQLREVEGRSASKIGIGGRYGSESLGLIGKAAKNVTFLSPAPP